MESFGEPHKRVVLWNPGYAKTRQGWEQLLQMVGPHRFMIPFSSNVEYIFCFRLAWL